MLKMLVKSIAVSIHLTLLVNAFIQAVNLSSYKLLLAGFVLALLLPLHFNVNNPFGGKNK